jgi:hypothetical protein
MGGVIYIEKKTDRRTCSTRDPSQYQTAGRDRLVLRAVVVKGAHARPETLALDQEREEVIGQVQLGKS